jgi:lipoprotein-anchoring transpeptidase ErfK/SrfK
VIVQQAAAPQIPAGGKKLIVVSISQQHVYAYQGGTLVYSFVASTGSGNSTRTGTFSILDKIPRAYGSTWGFWMPDWMGIYYAGDLEDGFHSLPLLANGQRLWGDSIGTPVTYGCIVLGLQDSRTLYNWAEIGTTVQIKR